MPSKRDVLAYLSRDELLAAADQFELAVPDRRVKDQLVDAVASSKRAALADILPTLPRDRLKELCRALGLDDSGKEKAVLVWRIIQAAPVLVDYVVAHELVHLLHRGHSPRLWATLGRIMPEYESRRARLRTVGPRLLL